MTLLVSLFTRTDLRWESPNVAGGLTLLSPSGMLQGEAPVVKNLGLRCL